MLRPQTPAALNKHKQPAGVFDLIYSFKLFPHIFLLEAWISHHQTTLGIYWYQSRRADTFNPSIIRKGGFQRDDSLRGAGSCRKCVSVGAPWVNLFSEAPMTLIWTTTMAPFSSLAHAWLGSLNMAQGEIIHTPEPPTQHSHAQERARECACRRLICHTCCRGRTSLLAAGTRRQL